MFNKNYSATTSRGKSDFIGMKYVVLHSIKTNTDDIYVALAYDVSQGAGKPETDYIALGWNEKRFLGAPQGKVISHVHFYSASGTQTLNIIGRDATIEEPVSNVEVTQAFPYWEIKPPMNAPFTERWEFLADVQNRVRVMKEKYQGRMGAFWKSESGLPEHAWTLPKYLLDQAGIDPAPWNNVIDMTNSKDGTTIDEIYFAIRQCYKRARMRLTTYVPNVSGLPAGTHFYFGFEAVSQGGSAIIYVDFTQTYAYLSATFIEDDGTLNSVSVDITSLITMDAWREYQLEFDPPIVRLMHYTGADYALVALLPMPNAAAHDILIPFFANESSSFVSGYKISHINIRGITHVGNTYNTKSYTNPASNPTLIKDVGNRSYIEVFAQSIAGSQTVKVYGSVDRTNWRLCDTLTTDATTKQVHKGYDNAYRFIEVIIEETGTGTSYIEITASKGAD